MIWFILSEIIVLLIIIFLFYLLSWFWPPDSPWAPWWKTDAKVARAIKKVGKITEKDLVYELGSGDGENLRTLAKEFGIKSVGIEVDPLRVTQSRILNWKEKTGDKITIIKKNFHEVDLSPATVVYTYLVPRALLKLQPKLEKELKEGTRVISYRYPIPYFPIIAENKPHKLFVYEVPKKKKGEVKVSKKRIPKSTKKK